MKQAGEEQSVSAHFVIHDYLHSPGVYRGALEEIPGITMGLISR